MFKSKLDKFRYVLRDIARRIGGHPSYGTTP